MLSKLLSKLSPHSPTIIDATVSSPYSSSSSNLRPQDDLSTALAKHNTVEAHLAQVENRLKNWSIPKLEANQVYKINTFNFSQQDVIVITEENVAMKNEFTAIKLLPEETLFKVKEKFKYLHIGCVQVALKPLFREGLDVPVYLALRDKRHLRFTPSLLGIVQSNLEQGPVYFNCRPDLTVSLQDKNIMDTISLDVHSQRLELKDGSLPFAVSYRIYFKLMHTNLSPKALGISPKGYTMLMEVNVEKSSMTIPRNLKWDELTKNPIWKLQGETTPIKRSSTEASITEFPDGNVEVQFNTGISYPRISEIMSSRPSTSSIKTETSYKDTLRRSESIRASVDFSHTIPDVHYEKKDGSLYPTQSDMEKRSEPVYNQINVISDEKERFREHYSVYIDQWIKAPAETRKPFLTMPDFVEGMLKMERIKNEALVKKLQADGQVAMIKGSTNWVTASGKEIASNYPPEEEAYFPHPAIPAIKMVSSPYKTINEDKVQKVGVREIKNIQHQLNFTDKPNSFNIGRLKEDASDYLAEINKRLAAISLNKDSKTAMEGQEPKGINMIKKDSLPQTSNSKILPVAQWIDMKNHYPQPSPPDLGWDDLHHEKRTYDGQSLITWNIDGYSKAQMMNTFQEMLLAATAYSTKKSTYETTQILILGFNGNLRSWWHNLLTEQDRQRILTATRTVVKTKNTSTPIQVEQPDMGHYANRCPLKDKINAMKIDEETKQSLLYAIRSDDDTSSQTESSSEEDYINILQEEGSSSEEEFYSQSDSSDDEGAIPCTGRCAGKCSGHINVITKDQETLFDLIEQIPDEEAKRTCLLKLKQSLEEQVPQKTIQNTIMYSYQDILNRVKGEAKIPIQVEDLHHEEQIKTLYKKDLSLLSISKKLRNPYLELVEILSTSSSNYQKYTSAKEINSYLSREHLLKTTSSALNPQPNGTASWPATATEPTTTAAKQSK
ncbi:movement protein [Cucumis melo var. makuwa]|uniref:Movement protein n=3 Tax=Cucumis melo TaxID=3656 RepID=A0A5D3C4I7_CUCMM|nr:movement protein [Cucumis melo var. makuwa]TYK06295.1 movement protein [Cucumis melo var. makuwa]